MAEEMSEKLSLAILAMDAYNRGYNAGIGNNSVGLGVSGAIGNATIGATSLNLGQTGGVRNDQAASFFAISYNWNGQTIISYRGTDRPRSSRHPPPEPPLSPLNLHQMAR